MAQPRQAPSIDKLPTTVLKGVGAALALKLTKLHLHSVQDILFHFPMRYLDRTKIVPIGHLAPNTSVVIEGTIANSAILFGKRRSLLVSLQDATGRVGIRFFHFNAAQKNLLREGAVMRCYGDPQVGSTGLELYHPEYDIIQAGQACEALEQRLTPIYPSTNGVNQNLLRKLTAQAIAILKVDPIEDLLPKEANDHFGINHLSDALSYVHYPPQNAPVEQLQNGTHPFQQRLAFEEMLAHHLILQYSRALIKREKSPALSDIETQDVFFKTLPFALTGAQQKVIGEINKDMAMTQPMLRLIQGDVGSGKTLVAASAAINALACKHQVALVAPTEILAEQHFKNFEQWLPPLGFKVTLLLGKLTQKQKREAHAAISDGNTDMVIGTHALFEDSVEFTCLGLVIIDEQHRFGVQQRLSLRCNNSKQVKPHQLLMTATPIPRTLAMTSYADLDLSIIDELPPGRTPINTVLVSQDRRHDVIGRVHHACQTGRQAYWVCTLIEDSETLSASAAEDTVLLLRESLPTLTIGLVHGRLKSREKAETMAAFKNGDIQLLVATTVIEVGVDVPNASLMIIENPERLGLAQLHQLRGRVGRGSVESHCVLLFGHPLSQTAKQRLQVLRSTHDGFIIAEEDLKIRGPGELLGTRQTGDLQFKLADLQRDALLIPLVHKTATQMLKNPQNSHKKVILRWFSGQQEFLNG